jgi:hypothetical protein
LIVVPLPWIDDDNTPLISLFEPALDESSTSRLLDFIAELSTIISCEKPRSVGVLMIDRDGVPLFDDGNPFISFELLVCCVLSIPLCLMP